MSLEGGNEDESYTARYDRTQAERRNHVSPNTYKPQDTQEEQICTELNYIDWDEQQRKIVAEKRDKYGRGY